MKNKNLSLIFNISIVISELIALVVSYKAMNRICFEYYTIDSNIIALISSFIFSYFLICKKKIPKWLKELKYLSTIGLSITFLVVLFILLPMANFNFYTMLVKDSLLFHHVICPIFGIITFIFFDELGEYSKKDIIRGLYFTFLYAIVLIILNLSNVLSGPYPFLKVNNQTILTSILWFISLIGLAYLIAYILRRVKNKHN